VLVWLRKHRRLNWQSTLTTKKTILDNPAQKFKKVESYIKAAGARKTRLNAYVGE